MRHVKNNKIKKQKQNETKRNETTDPTIFSPWKTIYLVMTLCFTISIDQTETHK